MPNSHLIRQAFDRFGLDTAFSLLVGDSVIETQASKSASITASGYTDKVDEANRLVAAGADVLVTSMKELTIALSVR